MLKTYKFRIKKILYVRISYHAATQGIHTENTFVHVTSMCTSCRINFHSQDLDRNKLFREFTKNIVELTYYFLYFSPISHVQSAGLRSCATNALCAHCSQHKNLRNKKQARAALPYSTFCTRHIAQ